MVPPRATRGTGVPVADLTLLGQRIPRGQDPIVMDPTGPGLHVADDGKGDTQALAWDVNHHADIFFD